MKDIRKKIDLEIYGTTIPVNIWRKRVEILRLMKMSYKIIVAGIPRSDAASSEENRMKAIHEGAIYKLTNNALNMHIEESYKKGNNDIEHSYYFVISCAKGSMEEAVLYFNSLESTVVPFFSKLGSRLEALSGTERLELFRSIYRSGASGEYTCNWKVMEKSKPFVRLI